MPTLLFIGFCSAYAGFKLLLWAVWLVQAQWWLPFCLCVFISLVALGLAWKAFNFAMLVLLGISTSRLAQRDFRNSLADWLVTARTGFKD